MLDTDEGPEFPAASRGAPFSPSEELFSSSVNSIGRKDGGLFGAALFLRLAMTCGGIRNPKFGGKGDDK